jgi:predicted protein tyrosine phosphatase
MPPPYREMYQGENRYFLVLDRKLGEKYIGTMPYAMISITNPSDIGVVPLQDDPLRRALLRQTFFDSEDASGSLASINQEQAQEIVQFVQSKIDGCELVLCQCEMGQSRSAAVGAAIAHMLGESDKFFFDHYTPNSRVYRMILDEYYRLVHGIEPYENSSLTQNSVKDENTR